VEGALTPCITTVLLFDFSSQAAPGVVCGVVYEAIKVGWRHIDCACDYGNEQVASWRLRVRER
jgi:diketogulonate reductase-like aldo/keto reductase